MLLRFFYVKIIFCVYFTHKMTFSQFSRVYLHYDVIVRSYINGWYLFWYQWKEEVHRYTFVALGLYDFPVLIIRRGLQQPLLRKICLERFFFFLFFVFVFVFVCYFSRQGNRSLCTATYCNGFWIY